MAELAALALYADLSLWFFGRHADWRNTYQGNGNDPIAFIWFLNWWPFAIRHGIDPFFTYFAWFPTGNDTLWNTSIPLPALLMAPITWAGGPVLSFNILTISAPALAAWTAFLLARRATRDWPAALICGYLFGFSSYELGQLLGHLNLEMTCLVPLAILTCVWRVKREISRPAFIVALAVIFILQAGTALEILASLGILGALIWLVFTALAPANDRRAIAIMALEIPAAAALAMLLLAPVIFLLMKGAGDVPPVVNSPGFYSTDVLNFVVPTWVSRFGQASFIQVSAAMAGNNSERGAYLGLPLLLIAAYFLRDNLARPYGAALLASAILLAILTLGPSLRIAGHDTGLPLPWALAVHLPLLKSALPTRFTMYLSLAMALIAAPWLAPACGWRRAARLAFACFACLTLAPNRAAYGWSAWPSEPFFTPAHLRAALGPMPNVLILPYGPTGPEMAWQLDSGMRFTQTGGYIGFTPWREHVWPLLGSLTNATPGVNFRNDLAGFCATHQIKYVLLGPGTPQALRTAIAAVNWLSRDDEGVTIVSVPAPSTLTYFHIAGDYWPDTRALNWMGRTATITTHGMAAILTISGAARPIAQPLMLTVSNQTGQTEYTIGQRTHLSIVLPATDTTTLTASSIFVPERVEHNKDPRDLSVLIAVIQAQ